jgi:hypothetical protein
VELDFYRGEGGRGKVGRGGREAPAGLHGSHRCVGFKGE